MKMIPFICAMGLVLACCKNTNSYVSEQEILEYTSKLGLPEVNQYRIKDSFQNEAFDYGQPFMNVYDKKFRELKIGTCYEELPYFIDTLLINKKLVVDTMSFYVEQPISINEKVRQIERIDNGAVAIDSTKKYYAFYHYAMYAKELDKVKIPPMYNRYKDSVQFFFINVDKRKNK